MDNVDDSKSLFMIDRYQGLNPALTIGWRRLNCEFVSDIIFLECCFIDEIECLLIAMVLR